MTNFILRPVFNRPEMLYLSIEAEKSARDFYQGQDYFTIFAVDFGGDPKCLDVIADYPYPHAVIKRDRRMRPVGNVLEGLKTAATAEHKDGEAPEFVINLEDDCIVHKTFFKYVDSATKFLSGTKYSVITTWGKSPYGDPNKISKGCYCCGPGTIINLDFFRRFVMQYANNNYYSDFLYSILPVNERNAANHSSKYHAKYGNLMCHLDWDGLVNRLVDSAIYEENIYSYSSECYRLLHIGFYGYNRHAGSFPTQLNTFEDRVKFLEDNMLLPDKMASLDKQYTDYAVFDARLEGWDGYLELL